jgi:hypothetical protein
MSYVPFTPLKFDDEYGLIPLQVKKEFYQMLPRVLIDNGISYKKKGGMVYVRRRVLQDEELIWNFTSRALDEKWLKQHPVR